MKDNAFYVKYLTDEGYRPKLDDDGDVLFKHEGGSYYLIAQADDPTFLQIFYPNFWKLEKPEDLEKAYRSASEVSRATKVTKVYVNGNKENVSASVELYIQKQEDLQHFLARALAAIRHAVREFDKNMTAA